MKKIWNDNVFTYVLMMLIYYIFWKIVGFELTCIMMGGTIIGGQIIVQREKEKNNKK